MIIPLRNPHYGSSWVEAHSVYFFLSLSLEREQGGSIMRRKYFFRARIHARSESRDWNTREISSLRLLLIQGYARLFVLVSLLLSPRARFFFFHYVTTERSISISRLGCVFGWNGTANDVPNNECETKREELGAFRNACTRTKSNLILSLVLWNRSSSKSDSFSDLFEFRSNRWKI